MYTLSITAHIVTKPVWELLQLPYNCDSFDAACEWVIRYTPQHPDIAIIVAEVYIEGSPRTRTFKYDTRQKCVVEMTHRRGWQPIPDLNTEQS